ncbi:MAG: sulfatase, partial [Rhodospirillales bacterium]|nr:sulfatase [Rhodospirillales bacterium]
FGVGLDDGALCVTRTADWKYVHFAGLPPVLYDRRRDPAEMHNVAGNPAHAPLLAEAAQRTLSWRLRHADRTLTHLCASPDGLVERR